MKGSSSESDTGDTVTTHVMQDEKKLHCLQVQKKCTRGNLLFDCIARVNDKKSEIFFHTSA